MSPKQVRLDQWCFVVDCAKRQEAIAFFAAPSPDDEPDVKQRTILKCQSCGHSDTYAPAL